MMRTFVATLALLSLVTVAAGCGAPALTCQSATCSNNAKTYQVCSNINATITYNFGGMSCNCSVSNCTSCTTMIESYCGVTGAGGSGGTGGSGGSGGTGGSGGGGGSQCSITLSGAVTGTFNCNAVTAYDSGKNQGTIALTVPSPSPLSSITVGIEKPGAPMSGVWSSSDAGATAGIVVQMPGGAMPATWDVSKGNGGPDQGSYTASVTVTATGVTGYTSTGSLTAVLPANTQTTASGTVNLSATF